MRNPAVRWWVLAWVVASALLVATPARALSPPNVLPTASSEDIALRGDAWVDASGQASVDTVRTLPAHLFTPLHEGRYLGLRPGQAAWIRFTARNAGSARWSLCIPDTRLERATLYTEDGTAQPLSAGDGIPVARWPIPQAFPLLPLALDAKERSFLLRIEATNDLSVTPVFESDAAVSASQQRWTLVHGLYHGLITMVVIYAWVCGFLFRDRAYAWLGAHALLVNLVVARVVGMAGVHLWPNLAHWNDVAEHVLSILCMAPVLGFVAVALSVRSRSASVYWWLVGLAGVAIAAGIGAAFLTMPARGLVAAALVAGLAVVGLATVAWCWWRGDLFARWILLAFMPLLVAVPLPLARWLQLVPQGFWTEHAIQAGLGLTLPAMLLLMMVRSHERNDYRRRISRIEQVDPLTGLVNDEVFEHRLRGLVQRSQRLGHASAVIVLEFTNFDALAREFGRKAVVEIMLRIAGRLTNTMRPMDTVARIGEHRFAVLMEGPVPPERCAQLASKIMARLILPFSGLPMGLVARPRIAVVAVPDQAASAQEAMQRLDALLLEAPPHDSRSIYVLESQPSSAPAAPASTPA